jgi:phosphopantetheine adenylyltransferase
MIAERHVLVVANETVAGHSLIEALERRGGEGPIRVTVVCPVSHPREGYVIYEDTRRTAARRRLNKTLDLLRQHGIGADGFVVDADPVDVVKDAFQQLEPPPDEIVVSTHPEARSGWLRRHVVDRIRSVAGDVPVEHVVVDLAQEGGEANVLVIANETVVGAPLLEKIRERAGRSPASFLIICPQSDQSGSPHPEAERRLRLVLGLLRSEGIDVHGQVAHPDPYTAAVHAVRDERVDEIIVSTFPGENLSKWLRGHLVERLRKDTKLPVDHVEVAVVPGDSREPLEVKT